MTDMLVSRLLRSLWYLALRWSGVYLSTNQFPFRGRVRLGATAQSCARGAIWHLEGDIRKPELGRHSVPTAGFVRAYESLAVKSKGRFRPISVMTSNCPWTPATMGPERSRDMKSRGRR
jgi:hypothetical protein